MRTTTQDKGSTRAAEGRSGRESAGPGGLSREAAASLDVVQRKPNRTGLPDSLKTGVESLSGVSLDDVRVHFNSPEPARYQALAYAQGAEIHVAPGHERHLPHEAWHVVQQRQGRVRPTMEVQGAPVNDDRSLEREAETMGSRAMATPGVSAATVQSVGMTGSRSDVTQRCGVVQRFVEAKSGGKNWRVADDYGMAVRQDSDVYGGRFFYALPSLISTSDSKLKSQKSALSLAGGGETMHVKSSKKGIDVELERVVPTNKSNKSTGNDRATGMTWVEDCGLAANAVMHGGGLKTKGVYQSPSSVIQKDFNAKLMAHLERIKVGERTTATAEYGGASIYEVYRGRKFYSPHKMFDEIMSKAAAMKPDDAWKAYKALSVLDKDKFDQEVGLNRYATPEVGEAYSIVANKDEQIDQGTWNFHWGGVVMKSGGDTVTMENFAGSGTDAWDFQMYGPASKPGQTFHEQQKERTKKDGITPEYGDNPTTIRVRPVP